MKRLSILVFLLFFFFAYSVSAENNGLILSEYDHDQVLKYITQEYDLTNFTGSIFSEQNGNIVIMRNKPRDFDGMVSSSELPFWFGYVNANTREGLLVLVLKDDDAVLVQVLHLDYVSNSSVAQAVGLDISTNGSRSLSNAAVLKGASIGLIPLTELGSDTYLGSSGGLYPNGMNTRPADHNLSGLALSEEIMLRALDGSPDPDGKIVLLSIGMSNTSQEFAVFQDLARREPSLNPSLVLVNGAQGGMTASKIRNPLDENWGVKFWTTVNSRLQSQNTSSEQVQVVWLKEANSGPNRMFLYESKILEDDLEAIVHILRERFPNLKLVYLSSRIYSGYAGGPLNPEPFAYESGFSVKWLIERQIQGDPELNWDPSLGEVKAPWLSWGPYLWADGLNPREDNLIWEREDFGPDGTHPSEKGRDKVAELLLEFFKTDETAKGWFLR